MCLLSSCPKGFEQTPIKVLSTQGGNIWKLSCTFNQTKCVVLIDAPHLHPNKHMEIRTQYEIKQQEVTGARPGFKLKLVRLTVLTWDGIRGQVWKQLCVRRRQQEPQHQQYPHCRQGRRAKEGDLSTHPDLSRCRELSWCTAQVCLRRKLWQLQINVRVRSASLMYFLCTQNKSAQTLRKSSYLHEDVQG